MRSSFSAAAVVGLLATACAGPSLFTDMTSVSLGRTNDGWTRQPARMPLRGKGFEVPAKWRARRFQYGTDEVVAAAQRAAGIVREHGRRSTAGFADISRRRGGRSAWHKSHHSGRDIDVLFYSTDERRRPVPPPQRDMICYGGDGKPYVPASRATPYDEPDWEARRFDDARNWLFIEALLTDPTIRLQWAFVSNELESRLVRWARRHDRPPWLIEYARAILRQPGDSLPHDDHFHIRVYCSRADRFHGCIDRGPIWQHEKKTFKYGGPEVYDPVRWRQLGLRGTPPMRGG